MKEQLKAFLALEGYTGVKSNLPEFVVFLKKEYRHVSVIYAIELEAGSTFTAERYKNVYESAVKLLEENEFEEMHILTLLISDNPEHALEVCKEDKYAWVINRKDNELIIDEGKAEDFYGMKASLEMFLREPEAASRQIKDVEEKFLSDLKEQEKKLLKSIYIPWIAYILVALNCVVYIVCTSTGELLYNTSGMSVNTIIGQGQWYRLLTATFLHENISQLFYNMLILYLLGNTLEKRLGRWKFATSYLGCGLVSGLIVLVAQYFRGIDVISYGSGGAVYGLFGVALVTEFVTINWRRVRFYTVRRMILVILCVAISLYVGSQTTGVEYATHVSGLCVGVLFGMIWYLGQLRKKRVRNNED